jgi:hypothetical protein
MIKKQWIVALSAIALLGTFSLPSEARDWHGGWDQGRHHGWEQGNHYGWANQHHDNWEHAPWGRQNYGYHAPYHNSWGNHSSWQDDNAWRARRHAYDYGRSGYGGIGAGVGRGGVFGRIGDGVGAQVSPAGIFANAGGSRAAVGPFGVRAESGGYGSGGVVQNVLGGIFGP